MADLNDATDAEILDEIRARGIVASIWSKADTTSPIEDDEDAADLSDEQLDRAAQLFLEGAEGGLTDILGQRGNDYLSDKWAELKDEILSAVRGAPAP